MSRSKKKVEDGLVVIGLSLCSRSVGERQSYSWRVVWGVTQENKLEKLHHAGFSEVHLSYL